MDAASVGYPNGHNWMHQWIKTSLYLGRLRQVYKADPVNNIDLMAVVDAIMISCAHMWDAFKNDPGLPSITKAEVDAAMTGDANLRLCRDYASTAKHLKRRHPTDIKASVLEAGSRGAGNFVTIGYGQLQVRAGRPWTLSSWPTLAMPPGKTSWKPTALRNRRP